MTPLSEKLGYQFQDEALLKRALTHAGADSARSNERLEFLGDRVLALVVSENLYQRYPEEDEGALTRRVHTLVRWEACAKVGEEIGLWDHLVLTRSEAAGGRARGPIVGSACEAVGYVPAENLEGKALFRFFSTDGSARIWEVWRWPFAIRYSRILTLVK